MEELFSQTESDIFSQSRDELTKLANVPAQTRKTPLLFNPSLSQARAPRHRVTAGSVLTPPVQMDQRYWEESFVFMIFGWTFPSNTMKTLCEMMSLLVLPLLLSNLQTYHHWNLIGWYAQVRGGGDSAALLDSLALPSIGGGVCSYWRHEANVFLLWLNLMTHSSTASDRRSSHSPVLHAWLQISAKGLWGRESVLFYFT